MDQNDHKDCAHVIKDYMASRGVEANVSDFRPGMVMPPGCVGDELNLRCPHGVLMWAEPTGEQLIKWWGSVQPEGEPK